MPDKKNIPTKKSGISMVKVSIMAMQILVVTAIKNTGISGQLKKYMEAIAMQPLAISAMGYKKEIGCPHSLQRPLVSKYPIIGMRNTGFIIALQWGQCDGKVRA